MVFAPTDDLIAVWSTATAKVTIRPFISRSGRSCDDIAHGTVVEDTASSHAGEVDSKVGHSSRDITVSGLLVTFHVTKSITGKTYLPAIAIDLCLSAGHYTTRKT